MTFFVEISRPVQWRPWFYHGGKITVVCWLWFAVGALRGSLTDYLDSSTLFR